jgi:hypothetical protein
MTVRTTSKTVTFMHPFSLTGTDEVQPAGTYTVETDEELLQPSSLPAYRRIATLLRLERNTGTVLTQIVETNPVELAGALAAIVADFAQGQSLTRRAPCRKTVAACATMRSMISAARSHMPWPGG